MKRAILALAVLALFAGDALASVPDPAMCSVQPWDGFSESIGRGIPKTGGNANAALTVMVRANIGGVPTPIPGAYVEVAWREDCDICICVGALITGYTNANGDASLNVMAGGCCTGGASVYVQAGDDSVVPPALTVIRAYDSFCSPDSDDNCAVSLGDFTAFGGGFGGTSYCFDYNGDGAVGLGDFTYFGQSFGNTCVPS